ncbi:serine/threonine-protein kinase [Actinomadura sp. HBU206391]|uniref:serine/threonine-protein kinase n=1 Tax=Actinomadura sp. HBU206391 TaxID=2731692 RepID=UPI00164F9FEA|nr:serine/threonine-protein kinase [Actinomadura sp. HBU206391]MBC6457083.1 protein kinase [Actinomadura sp. HBU206391]
MASGLGPGDPAEVGDGRYELIAKLGQGGMGTVYLGRSLSGRSVAVKVIRHELAADPGFRQRFMREVDAARRVSGFHTAAVVDADAADDRPWLVTAYIPAPSLDQVIARHGPLQEPALYALGAGLAEALVAIHAADVMHRDLKPSNILLADDGPRVIDFGIARAVDQTQVTLPGYRVGTPGFLSPEQLTGDVLTPAVDVFALGVVLCRAAGTAPFGEGPVQSLLYRVVHQEPDLAVLPPELRDVVAACLAKDPSTRPSPEEVLRRLAARPRQENGIWLTDSLRTMIDEHRAEAAALTGVVTDRPAPPAAGRDQTWHATDGPAALVPPLTAPVRPPPNPGFPAQPPFPVPAQLGAHWPPVTAPRAFRQEDVVGAGGRSSGRPLLTAILWIVGGATTFYGVFLFALYCVVGATDADEDVGSMLPYILLALAIIAVGGTVVRWGSRVRRAGRQPGTR